MLPHLPPKVARPKKPVSLSKDDLLPPTGLVELRFDGSCPLNPGPMGIGYLLITGGQQIEDGIGPRVLVRVGAQVGRGTNNEAEYLALIAGLRHALRLGVQRLKIVSDSLLVVKQVLGHWKARGKLARHLHEVGQLTGLLQDWSIAHTYREGNTHADELSRSLVFEEPALPAPLHVKHGATPRQLQAFQAALIRWWWMTGRTRNPLLLGRIFGISTTVAEQIVDGETYREVTLDSVPDWHALAETVSVSSHSPTPA